MKKVLAIMGPTSVGKSNLAILMAQRFNGEIISCDSVAVYQGMDIGSAKPTKAELDLVVHHGIDIYSISQKMNVADFQRYAREKIEEISSRGKLPILVGGTGLYIKAILMDYEFQSESVDEDNPFENCSNQELHHRLQELDPLQADKIHVNNRQRLLRYFQQYHSSHKTRSELNMAQKHEWIYDYKLVYLTMDRELLKQRIEKRVEKMFEMGLEAEVRRLSDEGRLLDLPAFNAIGYREFKDYFTNEITLDELKNLIKTHTRQFAKRQDTWFRHQMQGEFLDVTNPLFVDKLSEEVTIWINSKD